MKEHPIEEYFDIDFSDKDLLKTALTHSSYANENGGKNNERLEFIGDAVVDLLIGEYLFESEKENEGVLTKKRANIVCEKSLSYFASLFNLQDYLFLGKGEEKTGGRDKEAIKADAFEALMGAVYIDQGIDACKKIVKKVMLPNLEYAYEETIDYKTTLQEYLQSDKRSLKYSIIKETGESHDRTFTARIIMDNEISLGEGTGKSHAEAEQNAAKAALEKLALK